MKVASTHEIIEKLVEYEKENGVGAVTSIARIGSGDRTVEYVIEVSNKSDADRVFHHEGYEETTIKISSIEDTNLFNNQSAQADGK